MIQIAVERAARRPDIKLGICGDTAATRPRSFLPEVGLNYCPARPIACRRRLAAANRLPCRSARRAGYGQVLIFGF